MGSYKIGAVFALLVGLLLLLIILNVFGYVGEFYEIDYKNLTTTASDEPNVMIYKYYYFYNYFNYTTTTTTTTTTEKIMVSANSTEGNNNDLE